MGQPPSQFAGYAQPPVIYASPANQVGQQFASPDDGESDDDGIDVAEPAPLAQPQALPISNDYQWGADGTNYCVGQPVQYN